MTELSTLSAMTRPLHYLPIHFGLLLSKKLRRGWLYRLTLHFQNLKRSARRFVVEHSDRQPPGIPSESVKVRSVLF
jgi:branched-subunit amino acid aminotransferase/4-amino-4-deoxychorismate lyase